MVIGPHVDTVANIVHHARTTLGDYAADYLASIAVDSWTAAGAVTMPARGRAAIACAQVTYAAARHRALGDVALAVHLSRLAECYATAWRAEVDATATAVPDTPPTA